MTTDLVSRIPKEHGVPVSEVVDLGGPVARIVRTTYAIKGSCWTKLVLMVPADPAHNLPGGSLEVTLSLSELSRFIERLAWPADATALENPQHDAEMRAIWKERYLADDAQTALETRDGQ